MADIGENQMLLGFTSPEYTPNNIVTIPMDIINNESGKIVARPKTIIIIGEKGAGKSILESIILFDNIVNKLHIPTVVVDASPVMEWHTHVKPITSMFDKRTANFYKNFLSQYYQEPKGYSYEAYKPAFDNVFKEEGVTKSITLTLPDFRELWDGADKLDAIKTLMDILETDDTRAAESMGIQVLSNPLIAEFSEINNGIAANAIIPGTVDNVNQRSRAFMSYLQVARLLGVLGDSDSNVNNNILMDVKEKDYVIIRSKAPATAKQDAIFVKNQAYTKVLLTKILNDRLRYISGSPEEKAKSHINHPFGMAVLIGEIAQLAPASGEGYLNKLLENLATLYRKAGVTLIGETQNAALLNPNLLAQADYIITSNLNTKANISVLKEKGVPSENIEILRHLKKEVMTSIGTKVSEFAIIDKHNKIRSFFPTLPCSAFKSVS